MLLQSPAACGAASAVAASPAAAAAAARGVGPGEPGVAASLRRPVVVVVVVAAAAAAAAAGFRRDPIRLPPTIQARTESYIKLGYCLPVEQPCTAQEDLFGLGVWSDS